MLRSHLTGICCLCIVRWRTTGLMGQAGGYVQQRSDCSGPAKVTFGGLTFSTDGNYIYYIFAESGSAVQTLYQIPVLGGTPRKLLSDVDTNVSFSPDGKQMAFVRVGSNGTLYDLMIANSDGSGERSWQAENSRRFIPLWTGRPMERQLPVMLAACLVVSHSIWSGSRSRMARRKLSQTVIGRSRFVHTGFMMAVDWIMPRTRQGNRHHSNLVYSVSQRRAAQNHQ